ncbi:DNA methyltransferase, partial [Planktothrix agardhii]
MGGAVTSPPYYNAREYSQWSNIYCYLYDMYNISKEVFRCLKHGSPYLFNIFDYFDNENIIVFSDMGKKRLILSSYISFIFRHIGFTHLGNIAWDKGEIEGNRNFNQGND